MPLFQNAVLNKYLSGVDEKKVEEAWGKFTEHFHNREIQENIRNSKEEEYQEGFLEHLFVNALGYTKKPSPNYNLVMEQKNLNDSKKADGALLDGEKVRGVIELKGTETTDLGKVETQAFGYKNKQPDALYVIISNFEKLRFYIDNAVDFLEFNLFQLTKEEFKLLWLCLGYSNFAKGLPKKIKDASLTEEENVTKKLYKDYSEFKHAVFESIKKHNPEYDKLLLFKKTQKLLDRFLFIFFAEDRLLLPPNSIREIIKQWMDLRDKYDEYVPLYDRFKKYFGYMNEGHKGKNHEIFAYNGGLFVEDEVLDNLKIDDELLYKHTMQLSNYDFDSEVDVNILGHIFEHSLNEIEEITAELEGQKVDTSKTRRKKDGVFYTPKYITKYIVENTVGKLCEEKKAELEIEDEDYRPNRQKKTKKELLGKLDQYREWLLELTICDPACGSGAFLNQALEFLIDEHTYVDELQAKLLDQPLVIPDIENQILENNLFGVDINEESVEIAKLSLWLRTAQKGRKLTSLNNHIKCGNSLIDDPEVAGDKAFKWEKEFPNVFRQKEKQVFHVTWVTHNARTSQRMKQFGVEKGDPFLMSDDQEEFVTREIARIVKEDERNVMAYNICRDHVHMLLVCEPYELSNIVRKLKDRSSQKLKEAIGIPKEEKFQLWAQKFNRKPITDRDGLANVQQYIFHNRQKHGLPPLDEDKLDFIDPSWQGKLNDDYEPGDEEFINQDKESRPDRDKGLQPLASEGGSLSEIINELCLTEEEAFRPEYTGGFDVVIGNPPYVFTRGNEHLQEFNEYIWSNYKYNHGKINLYSVFLEVSVSKLLREEGRLGFITPETFIRTSTYSEIRQYLINDSVIETMSIYGNGVFENVTAETIAMTLRKGYVKNNQVSFFKHKSINDFEVYEEKQESFKNTPENRLVYGSSTLDKLIFDKIKKDKIKLGEIIDVKNGIATKAGKNDFLANEKVSEKYEKLLEAPDLFRYGYEWPGVYINYDKEVLHRPRSEEIFLNNKILIQRVSSQLICSLDEDKYYTFNSVNNLLAKKEDISLRFYLGILNSKLIDYFYRKNYSLDAKYTITVTKKNLDSIPLPEYNNENSKHSALENRVEEIINLTNHLTEHTRKFLDLIQSKFDIEKLSRKLQSWHELAFNQFLKELKKKKVELTLEKEAEWMEYFNRQKAQADELKTQIAQTDKEIDGMVYELYGLSEEEIKVVEET
tara:strand:- start:13111 stop:16746 length:3636 start_codon:yes stop_codon:yes gene_type:complete